MKKDSSLNREHVRSLIDSIDRMVAARQRDREALVASLDEIQETLDQCNKRIKKIKNA